MIGFSIDIAILFWTLANTVVRRSRGSQLAAAREEINRLREHSQSTASALTSSVVGEPVSTTLDRLRDERDETREEYRRALAERQELATELAATEDEKERLQREEREMEATLSELQEHCDELFAVNEYLQDDKQTLEQALQDKDERIEELEEKIRELEAGTGTDSDDNDLPSEPYPEPEQSEELERLRTRVTQLQRQNQELRTQVEELTEKNESEHVARLEHKQEAQTQRSLAAGAMRRAEEALQEKARVEKDNDGLQERCTRMQALFKETQAQLAAHCALEQNRIGTEIDSELKRSESSERTAELREAKSRLQQFEETFREMQARMQELRQRRARTSCLSPPYVRRFSSFSYHP